MMDSDRESVNELVLLFLRVRDDDPHYFDIFMILMVLYVLCSLIRQTSIGDPVGGSLSIPLTCNQEHSPHVHCII